jgi:hypothetical protein
MKLKITPAFLFGFELVLELGRVIKEVIKELKKEFEGKK